MHVDQVPRRLVVDASVGLKWVLEEEQSDLATALGRGRDLFTSALFWVEAGNAIASRVRRGEIGRERGNDALQDLRRAPLHTTFYRSWYCQFRARYRWPRTSAPQ